MRDYILDSLFFFEEKNKFFSVCEFISETVHYDWWDLREVLEIALYLVKFKICLLRAYIQSKFYSLLDIYNEEYEIDGDYYVPKFTKLLEEYYDDNIYPGKKNREILFELFSVSEWNVYREFDKAIEYRTYRYLSCK
jgi:hypothetical protein